MNYTPTTAQRKEKRLNQNCQLHSVEPEEVKEETWQDLVGKNIFFWSWTITKLTEDTRNKYFIFHTVSDLGFYKTQRMLTKAYPDWQVDRWTPLKYGRNIKLPIPYILSHAIEVKTPDAILWLEFMEKTTTCLEKELRK